MNFDERYSRLDRFLYRTAFRTGTAQHALADVENILYDDTLSEISVDRPVFITALPRSGTTILLRLLWNTSEFASHTYQDMPFVLCPMVWDQFADAMGRQEVTQDRAHGDGLEVSSTSPEAFEDRIWKHFWDEHYRSDHIRPWEPGEKNREFEAFFESHMRKVIALRQGESGTSRRYLSKNNLNIARLAARPSPLDSGTFVIPFREPIQHAASMLRQHRRFLDLHDEDDFVREYMEAIGHHEFGKGLRPVNFQGWLEDAAPPTDLAFWIQYWTAAYRFVLHHAGSASVLVSYNRLTEQPRASLSQLSRALDLPSSALADQADRVRPPRTHPTDHDTVPDSILDRAAEIHGRLQQAAMV